MFFQKAIALASKTFYAQLEKADFEYDNLNKREKTTLLKYYNRTYFRPTPFGLFSAFCACDWGSDNTLIIGNDTVHTQKSFEEAILISQKLKHSANEKSFYSVNQTIYKCGKELRYLSSFPNAENTAFEFAISSIENHFIINRLFEFCSGKQSYGSLQKFLIESADMDSTEAVQLLNDLIRLQVLIDENTPNITGEDFLERITQGMHTGFIPENCSSNASVSAQSCFGKIITSENYYVNLERKQLRGTLNSRYQGSILKSIECLYWLSVKSQPEPNHLKNFVGAYNQKFEGQVLPLLYVMDPALGIGYKGLAQNDEEKELLRDIDWGNNTFNHNTAPRLDTHELLLRKWKNRHSEKICETITITDKDIESIQKDMLNVYSPPTISAIFRIVDDKIILESAGGATATSLIGRFTPFNEKIKLLADAVVEKEMYYNPDIVFAEIVHICEFHAAKWIYR